MDAGEQEVVLQDGSCDKFRCDFEMDVKASVIRLTNKRTGDVWSCEVTSQTVQHENSKHDNKLRLGNLQRLVMALLLDFLQGNLQNRGFQGLSLSQKHSPYSMKLKLDCSIDGRRGTWSFHMIPQDPGAIQKRELEEKDGKVK